jgi:hypothetical protein
VCDDPAVEVREETQDELLILISRDEAHTLNNALNEVCNGVHWSDSEFATRMGVTRTQARELLRAINTTLRA